jgi:hypothetical protein
MMKNNPNRGENSSPNSNSSPPLKELVGKIIDKKPKKVYDKTSPFLGNTYFKLKTLSETGENKNLFAYANVVSEEIFNHLEKSDCIDKRYLFFCEKKGKRLILHNLRELSANSILLNKNQF